MKKAIGPCPACDQSHMYEKTFPFGKGRIPTRRLSYCPKFLNMSPKERGELLENLNGCYHCTDYGHTPEECHWKLRSGCTEGGNGSNSTCQADHHPLLHDSGIAYCHSTSTQQLSDSDLEQEEEDL